MARYKVMGTGFNALSISEMKQANKDAGRFFFSPGAMAFFKSRVESCTVRAGKFTLFLTSEKAGDNPRRWTVRKFDPKTADIDTVGAFQAWATLRGAAEAMYAEATRAEEVRRV